MLPELLPTALYEHLFLCDPAPFYHADYVIPKDVQTVFKDVAAHRMVLDSRARYQEKSAREILDEILAEVPQPKVEG